jgi:hypothetical protein
MLRKILSCVLFLSLLVGSVPVGQAIAAKPPQPELVEQIRGKKPVIEEILPVLPLPGGAGAGANPPAGQGGIPSQGAAGQSKLDSLQDWLPNNRALSEDVADDLIPEELGKGQIRVIVIFREKIDRGAVENAKGEVKREFRNLPGIAINVPEVALDGLRNNPNILIVEPDIQVEMSQSQD